MPLLRLVPLLCCLLLPVQSLAQAQAPAPSQVPVTPPPLIPAPGTSEQGTEERDDDPYGGYEGEDEPRGEIIPSEERYTDRSGSASRPARYASNIE